MSTTHAADTSVRNVAAANTAASLARRRRREKDVDEDKVAKILAVDSFAVGSPVRYAKVSHIYWTLKSNSAAISNITNISSFAARFARRSSLRSSQAGRRAGTPQGLQSPFGDDGDGYSDHDEGRDTTTEGDYRLPSRGGTAMAETLADADPKNRARSKVSRKAAFTGN